MVMSRGFSTKTGLPARSASPHEVGVRVVRGEDEHRVDVGVVDDLAVVVDGPDAGDAGGGGLPQQRVVFGEDAHA